MDVEVFLLEEEEALGGSANAAPADELLMQAHIAYLLRAPSAQAAKVAHDVKLCCLRLNLLTGREMCSAQELAAALAARGHAVSVLKSSGGGAGVAAFRNLRHTFLSIAAQAPQQQPVQLAAAGWHSSWEEEEEGREEEGLGQRQAIIVDPHFRCQFVLAAPSPRYAALQRLLPQTFVGTREQLEHVVEWASREMAWSFKEAGLALPPWREQGAMLSKWRVAASSPGACSPCSSPRAAPPAACCCCCQGQGAAAAGAHLHLHAHDVVAAAAELAAGQRSPCSVVAGGTPSPYFGSSTDRQAAHGSSTPVTPTTHCHASAAEAALAPRVSLLSRSLEAAGLPARLRRAASSVAGGHHWWEARTGHEEPRTITVVRRSAP